MIKASPLRHRYLAKLLANSVGAVLFLATLGLVPRVLGPTAFGRYEYLTNFFQQIVNLVDSGTSSYFYTSLSQRPKDLRLLVFYVAYTLAFVIVLGLTILFLPASIRAWLWPDESVGLIFLAFFLGFSAWWLRISKQIADAYALTVNGEKINVAHRTVAVAVLVLLVSVGVVDLVIYYWFMIAMACLGVGLYVWFVAGAKVFPTLATRSDLPSRGVA